LDRREAVWVLRVLSQLHREIAFADFLEVNKASGTEGYELRIKCVLDAHGRNSISGFLEKRKLKMRDEKGLIIIYE